VTQSAATAKAAKDLMKYTSFISVVPGEAGLSGSSGQN
jgi:hypothetical protein